ncbi:cytochrome P450 [Aspergillus aurantiobrunneus]
MGPISQESIILSLPWGWAFILVPVLYLVAYCIYNAYFHPFAKYPGPFLSKFTMIRATYHAWKGDVHLDTWRCHKIYGPVIRYGPDKLVFSTPKAMKGARSTDHFYIYSVGSNVTKDPAYATLGQDRLNLVSLVDKKEHLRRRKLVTTAFSFANVKMFEPNMQVYVQRFVDALSPLRSEVASNTWGPSIDVADWCSFLTFDVMTDFLFGLEYDLLRSPCWRKVVHDIESTNVRLYVLCHLRWLYLGRIDKLLFPAATRGSRGFLKFVDQLIKDYPNRKEGGHIHAFTRLTGAKDKEGRAAMSSKQVYSEAVMLVTAAQDTTSVTLRAILFYLSRYPHAYAKLAQEIRSTFAADETISCDGKLKGCTYLNACILEAMRISPAITGAAMFRHVSAGGQTVDGEHIPAGYNVSAGIYAVHHNEELFPRAFEFIPERWIVDEHTSQEQLDQRLKMWFPFSMGPRACIGKTFAETLISITIASVVRIYDFRVAHGPEGVKGSGHPFGAAGRTNPGEFQLQDYIVSTGEGPVLQMKLRG